MAAINAFKANPALAFSQFSKSTPSPGPASKGSTPESQSRPSTPGPAALDQIDGVLASQLKRLGKQDSKTKMRALFELKSYVGEHTWETGLEGMMLAWPPLFRKHIFDPDRRVRAAVANVNAALVKRVGKRLAPNLSQLIAPWIASYFDPHREVAKTSKQAFESVFPESKRSKVFSYCLGELVEFASDNIINQTPETLSDPRFADAEEMRSKYEQVVGVSFGMLGLAIDEVEASDVLERKADFDAVMTNKTALQFLASPVTFIRRAVYRFIRTVMLKCPQLAEDSYGPMAHKLLSSAFGDNDPTAHGDMWDAVLLTTKNYPQAWPEAEAKSKGKKSSVVDKLFAFLATRCRMAPTISYPSVLALLANLPAEILDEPTFQTQFRSALWQGGMESEEAAGSATKIGAKAAHLESVALVSAVCECFSFLWTRSLKASGAAAVDSVSKEAAQEVDRLWHFYLEHSESADEMSAPFCGLYCKLESLSARYDPSLLSKVWAQASWFALQRLSGNAVSPIVHLTAQIADLDPAQHAELVGNARKLLVAFCQLAIQSPDDASAQSLIQALAQLAPSVVFHEGFADKFSVRLEGSGSCDEAINLVLSKAQYVLDTTQSLSGAAKSLDSFIASSLERAQSGDQADSAYRLVTALLKALPEAEVSKNAEWPNAARFPSLDRLIASSLPQMPASPDEVLTSAVAAPPPCVVQLYCQSLLLYFCGTEHIADDTVNEVFEWMEQAFKLHYDVQWVRDVTKSVSLESWTTTTYEVLSAWTALARDQQAGPRFVRFWLAKSGSQAHSALGLLFDFAISSADADANAAGGQGAIGLAQSKLYPQAKRAWSATESQLERLHLGSELSRALSESISHDLIDLQASKNPSHLARLANSVFTRICPQDDSATLESLISSWLLDEGSWKRALELDSAAAYGGTGFTHQYLRSVSLGTTALRQAVDDFAPKGAAKSFHTLARWSVGASASANSERRGKAAAAAAAAAGTSRVFDVFGLSRFARRALFSIDFIQLSGGLSTLSAASSESVSTLVLYMALAYVLLRESLASASGNAEDTAKPRRMSVVKIEEEDSRMFARVSAAAKAIEDVLSDLLSLAVVYGSSLPRSNKSAEDGPSDDGDESGAEIRVPSDPGRWLNTLTNSILEANSTDRVGIEQREGGPIWEQAIAFCIACHKENAASPWALVLGTLTEWCQWADPVGSADIEAAVAVPMSKSLPAIVNSTPLVELMTAVVRAASLRHECSQSPALRGTMLDLVGYLGKAVDKLSGTQGGSQPAAIHHLVAGLELLGELLPPQQGSLDANASTPKITRTLLAIPDVASDRDAAASSATSLPLTLAGLLVLQRFADCAPVMDDASAVGLARLCLRWLTLEVADDVVSNDALLVAASRAVSSLAKATKRLVNDSRSVAGPLMRQIGERLVETCVLSERPIPEGVSAVAQLVKCGYFSMPSFTSLFPVLANATPMLDIELLQLALASGDVVADIGSNVSELVRLVILAVKALADLGVPYEDFGEAVESDDTCAVPASGCSPASFWLLGVLMPLRPTVRSTKR
ncbi:hypothetical protein GQ54DRAFT_43826 [Martensiomyces pterosporus]|nr:hypothetical protein GQ54DRAFT_43826 [Martensiomyces pterosporus]